MAGHRRDPLLFWCAQILVETQKQSKFEGISAHNSARRRPRWPKFFSQIVAPMTHIRTEFQANRTRRSKVMGWRSLKRIEIANKFD